MADKIVISGVKPFDGEWDFDIEEQPFTNLEWRLIKKITGCIPMTINAAWKGGDPDVYVAFALIALVRAGKLDADDALDAVAIFDDAPADGTAIKFVGETRPPDESQETTESEPGSSEPPAMPSDSSGNASTDASETA